MASLPGICQQLDPPTVDPTQARSLAATNRDETLVVTLDQAISLAEANEPSYVTARAESRALALDRLSARAALLPSATSHNQTIYTQPNGVPSSRIGQTVNAAAPIFIANNAVREYVFQGLFNETVGLQQVGTIRLADATAARATAELEIARRGLVSTVVQLFDAVGATASKLAAANRARLEADQFVTLTREREAAREAAHSDVLKAQLQAQTRDRELQDAKIAAQKARLELAVLLFRDPSTSFTTAPREMHALPDFSVVQTIASAANPALSSALSSLELSRAQTFSAKAALLPDLSVNVTYGIDATSIAATQIDPDGSRVHNLGYSGTATLDVPLWDWLTSERKIKQARIREQAAHVGVTIAERRLLVSLTEFYTEAETASRQLTSLAESVRDARESLRLTNLRYVDGESTALEVVDAQNTVIQAEQAQIDGRVRYDLALAQLQTLTGRL